jgi:hypothetical protein
VDEAAQLSRGSSVRIALAAFAVAWACSCISVDWTRGSRQAPPPKAAVEALQVGTSTLKDALDLLGAPLDAYEYRETGMALAYGWHRSDKKGLRVSVPLYDRASASADFSRSRRGLDGLLLLFDEELNLVSIRKGWLEDLTSGFERQPPAVLDDAEQPKPTPPQ